MVWAQPISFILCFVYAIEVIAKVRIPGSKRFFCDLAMRRREKERQQGIIDQFCEARSLKDIAGLLGFTTKNLSYILYYAEQNKIEGKGYIILNAKNQIKDTIIGTIASILSFSKKFKEG